jgi:hypothetical protein
MPSLCSSRMRENQLQATLPSKNIQSYRLAPRTEAVAPALNIN